MKTLILTLALCAPAQAVDFILTFPVTVIRHPVRELRQHPARARRVLGVLAASADIGDMVSTFQTVCRPPVSLNACLPSQYAHETNTLFAPNGVLLAKRFTLFKLAVAAGLTGGEEIPHVFHFRSLSAWDRAEGIADIGAFVLFGAYTVNNGVVYATTHAQK